MLITQQDKIREQIEALAKVYGKDRSALMPILQAIQRKFHSISDFAMQCLADILGIHPVEVYGVVTFYSFLSEEYHGKFVIRLCRTISCDMAGKEKVARQLENDLGVQFGDTTKDGVFTLEWANCLGMCDQGPAMMVNDRVFTKVTPESVHQILNGCRNALSAHAVQREQEELV